MNMFLTEFYSSDYIKKDHTVESYGTHEEEEGKQNFGKKLVIRIHFLEPKMSFERTKL
jgi:hypothetical protein